ncbi:putative holin-like toxin [Schleiferilactobacillus harbinensis]|uniref:Putative holin-like toxin n=1 Tax=Schleiferilactobacillus harbinensis TaxID=304207 RepID=A0A5P8Q2K5_9LACO|nr:putative holin-like toxin [Schleiferilactobacillus harbinensis]QEU47833.1 putative holin-like toxin [Schleiferilactobacillus harbinensis]QFR24869.1 putative holin-like toxin [Schleiferilactobacillus harbinensis]QFR63301.1 putative holin-like toxin [Schleiferilactobacillus harbinensis]
MSTGDALQVMVAFGIFVVALITLVVKLIDRK